MNLSHIPIIDHHAHPLLKSEAITDAISFQQWFTESSEPEIHARHVPHSLFFKTSIRWLAELLGCEANLDSVLAARAAQDYKGWSQRLFNEANIRVMLCDYGHGGPQAYNHAQLQAMLPCQVEPILRLEPLAQDLIIQHDTFEHMLDAFINAIAQARAEGYIALKSIVAYRSGLAVADVPRIEAVAAFKVLKDEARRTGQVRLHNKPLNDYLLWHGIKEAEAHQLPLQIHTGFGDNDADLREANPLHLRAFIEHTRCPLVILHAGWPFYREAAHLAAIYSHVWLDLSLAIPFATTGIPTMIQDILGMTPFSKVMFATDAFTMPEIFWLAARWGRWGLGRVLDEFVADDFLTTTEAEATAEAILGENARGVYGLD